MGILVETEKLMKEPTLIFFFYQQIAQNCISVRFKRFFLMSSSFILGISKLSQMSTYNEVSRPFLSTSCKIHRTRASGLYYLSPSGWSLAQTKQSVQRDWCSPHLSSVLAKLISLSSISWRHTIQNKKASINLVFEGTIRNTTVLGLPVIRARLGQAIHSARSHPCEEMIARRR